MFDVREKLNAALWRFLMSLAWLAGVLLYAYVAAPWLYAHESAWVAGTLTGAFVFTMAYLLVRK